MSDEQKNSGNVTSMPRKGFRTPPKPSKGEVAEENKQLSERVITMLNFLNQQLLGLMRKSHQHDQELGAVTELLGYNEIPDTLAKGDKALVSFLGRFVNEDGSAGDPFDGGFSRMTLIGIGAGKLIPGFEDALIGHGAGETVKFEITFPENYHPSFKGKKAVFEVDVFRVYRAVDKLFRLEAEYTAYLEALAAARKAEQDAAKAAEGEATGSEAPAAEIADVE